MPNSYFRFKQFTVNQDTCAMKVGTDGVLLGTWASVKGAGRILDVGTGTGLIALMAAQRSGAFIDAIDLDADACRQADENVQASPFTGRIRVHHASFASFCASTEERYDCILSNPPYFHASLKGPDDQRNTARHTDTLPLEELIGESRHLLTPNGRIALILPADREERLLQIISENSLYPVRQTMVLPTPDAPPKRILIEIASHPVPDFRTETLSIELSRHQYTPDYIALTRDFYLKM